MANCYLPKADAFILECWRKIKDRLLNLTHYSLPNLCPSYFYLDDRVRCRISLCRHVKIITSRNFPLYYLIPPYFYLFVARTRFKDFYRYLYVNSPFSLVIFKFFRAKWHQCCIALIIAGWGAPPCVYFPRFFKQCNVHLFPCCRRLFRKLFRKERRPPC